MQEIEEGKWYEILHANGDIKGAIGQATDIQKSCFGHIWTAILIYDGERTYFRRVRASDVELVTDHLLNGDKKLTKKERKKKAEYEKWIANHNRKVLIEAQL